MKNYLFFLLILWGPFLHAAKLHPGEETPPPPAGGGENPGKEINPPLSETPIKEDFEGPFRRVFGPLENYLGSLPEGWEDHSGPGAKVFYRPFFDNPAAGKKALQMLVQAPGRESAILEFKPVPLRKGRLIKLGLSMRSDQPFDLTLGLRSGEGEQRIYLEEPIPSEVEWNSGQLVFRATVDDPKAVFYLRLEEPGAVDLDNFFIAPYKPETGKIPALTIENSPNLLPTSSFPDGVHAPWALLNAKTAKTDPLEFGPSGLPSLRVSGAGASLTIPFLSEGAGDYTFSLFLKGALKGQTLSLILAPPEGNQQVYPYRQTVRVETVWRRYSSTVPLDIPASGFFLAHLILHSEGNVWVDGMQVEKASAMSPLARTAPVELVAQPHNPDGIHFEGESFLVRVTVYGALPAGTRLKATLFDVEGEAYRLDPLPLNRPPPLRENLLIEPKGEPPLGSYRLELQVMDKNNEPLSRLAEVLLHRVRLPLNYDRFNAESYFGIQLGKLSDSAEELGLSRALGFKWVEDTRNYSWAVVAPEADAEDFSESDYADGLYRHYKMAVLGVLGPVPRWAVEEPENFPLDLPLLPKDLTAWRNYARTMVKRYEETVQAWQPWPYPYTEHTIASIVVREEKGEDKAAGAAGRTAQPILSRPEDYVAMQKSAYEGALEAADKPLFLMDLNLNGDRSLAKAVLASGIEGAANVISFQDDFIKEEAMARLKKNHAWLLKHIPPAFPLWRTRANASAPRIFNFYRHSPPLFRDRESTREAAEIIRYYLALIASGVKRVFVSGFPANAVRDLWRPGPRIFNVDGRLNPNATALSNLMRHLEGKTFFRADTVRKDFDLFTFQNAEGAVGILLSRGNKALKTSVLPDGIEVRDLFGNIISLPAELGRAPTYFSADDFSAPQMRYLFKTIPFEEVE